MDGISKILTLDNFYDRMEVGKSLQETLEQKMKIDHHVNSLQDTVNNKLHIILTLVVEKEKRLFAICVILE
jgi:hypothetical protein